MLFYISYNSSKLQSARSLNIWQSSFTRNWNGVFTKCLKENISAFQVPNPAVLTDTSGQCHYPVWLTRRPFPGAYWQWQLSTSHAVIILKSWVARIAHSWIYHRPGFPCASSLCHPRVGLCSQDMQNSWRNWHCQPPNEYFHTRAKCPTRSACIQLILHARIMGARHVWHTSGMPGQKYERCPGSRRFGLSTEELGAPFSNPRCFW